MTRLLTALLVLSAAVAVASAAAAFPTCPAGTTGAAYRTNGSTPGAPSPCLISQCRPAGQKVRTTHVGQCLGGFPPDIIPCNIVDDYTLVDTTAWPSGGYCAEPVYSTNAWH
jgi:hypothetical protein